MEAEQQGITRQEYKKANVSGGAYSVDSQAHLAYIWAG
jgi:hypothetical protein